MKQKLSILLYFSLVLILTNGQAQVRLKIDEERKTIDYSDKKGLELSEKFIKLDKNYYVGHMYQGTYKFNRASDYFGFKTAIEPLELALKLLEKDYDYKIRTRTADLRAYIDVYQYQKDFTWICSLLYDCYSNIEQQEEVMRILRKVKSKKIQLEFYGDPYANMSWVIHRNRFHTSEKYSFLKNSIEANELLALKYLDSSMVSIQKNYYINSNIYPSGVEEGFMRSVYWNKTIIYSYNFEMDSAEYYYDLLKATGTISYNNYAYTKLMNGEFKEAAANFEIEKKRDNISEKRTKEFYYMLALLSTYKAKPDEGIKDLQDIISKQGSTPGFGWNNLGLARGYYYNGQLFESQKHLDKASEFEEMHIGTTWVPEQYEFMKNISSYLNKERKIKSIPFENKGYWYNLPTLVKMLGFSIDEQSEKFLLVNKFGANPERDYVYYHMFSPENMVTFDETWKIIDGLDANFFIKKFSDYLVEDSRENIKRYYRYFLARLLVNKGEYIEAEKLLLEVLKDPDMDQEFEKMLQARCHEVLCKIYNKNDNAAAYKNSLLSLYSLYPQLMPFTGLTMTFNLQLTTPNDSEDAKKIIKELYGCKIKFLNPENRDSDYPTASIGIEKVDSVWLISSNVFDRNGASIAKQESFKVDEVKNSGKRLAYYLFNIPATTIPDYGDNNYWIIFGVLIALVILWAAHSIKKSLKF